MNDFSGKVALVTGGASGRRSGDRARTGARRRKRHRCRERGTACPLVGIKDKRPFHLKPLSAKGCLRAS